MEWITQTVQAAIEGNEFFAGGFLLMIIGAVGVAGRQLPMLAWKRIERRFTVNVEIRVPQVVDWFDTWLLETAYNNRCLLLKAKLEYPPDAPLPVSILVPGHGRHVFRHDGRWFMITRQLDTGNDQSSGGLEDIFRQEVVTVRTFGRSSKPIQRMLDEARNLILKRTQEGDEVVIHINGHYKNWCAFKVGHTRPLSSVILEAGASERILADVKHFMDCREWYLERGIPYRRGYLLEGPPGGGKSSYVKAISNHLRLRLYVLDVTESSLTDLDVARLMAELPSRSVVLIEDVDCIGLHRDKGKKKDKTRSQVTLSGLLNALDGVIAAEGRILFMTANHSESLDPALVREGRVDIRQHIGLATADQARRMFLRFFADSKKDAEEFGRIVGKLDPLPSMATVQGMLISRSDDSATWALRSANREMFTPKTVRSDPASIRSAKGEH